MEELNLTAVVIVAALLSVGLVQALIGIVKRWGVKGEAINVAAIVFGAALALLARAVFPEQLTAFTYAQMAVFGGLNGLASTGLWRFRRGDEPAEGTTT